MSGEQAPNPFKIFIGNLAFSLTQEAVAKLFRPFGTVVGVKLVEDRGTGKKKGFGFITFESADAVERAIAQMDGAIVAGRPMTVKSATARGEKGDKAGSDGEEEEKVTEGGERATEARPTRPSEDPEKDAEDEGWTDISTNRKKGKDNNRKSFQTRAQEKSRQGGLLGWGAGKKDWA
eukprot:TRINITY_DN24221_c0_g1_i1.p1 TRINITY_DN24221_c0_g1~~TRINITY_DN24221_c0_g1_i1.p1  ORF type:complete len:203 (-),score=41.11 TRINITY_DN24221_c0_g1_i1:53-583(-)